MPPEPLQHSAAPTEPTHVVWNDVLPPLPPLVQARARRDWALDVSFRAGGADPLIHASFADLLSHLRVQQVVRALAARTNRQLAGTRVTVVGSGPLAEAARDILSRIGARVTVSTDDPAPALRARTRGYPTATLGAIGAVPAEHVIVTGEGHAPLDTRTIAATAIDASFRGDAVIPPAGSPAARPGVIQHGAGWVVAAPSLWADDITDGAAVAERAVLSILTLSRIAAGDDGARDIDTRFAREALA